MHFGSASPDNVPDLVLAGEDVNTNIYFGMSVSFAGDVNGDGNTDIIASGYGLSSQGSAYILLTHALIQTCMMLYLTVKRPATGWAMR